MVAADPVLVDVAPASRGDPGDAGPADPALRPAGGVGAACAARSAAPPSACACSRAGPRARRRRSGCSPPARSRSSPTTTTPPWAPWPAPSPATCGSGWWRTRPSATAPTAARWRASSSSATHSPKALGLLESWRDVWAPGAAGRGPQDGRDPAQAAGRPGAAHGRRDAQPRGRVLQPVRQRGGPGAGGLRPARRSRWSPPSTTRATTPSCSSGSPWPRPSPPWTPRAASRPAPWSRPWRATAPSSASR